MVKTEKHILSNIFTVNMAVETVPDNLESEVESCFIDFVDKHKSVLKDALKREYVELPEIPEYDLFLNKLYDKSESLAEKYKTKKEDVHKVIGYFNGVFYRYTLPSLND